jgi:hypothetical protein
MPLLEESKRSATTNRSDTASPILLDTGPAVQDGSPTDFFDPFPARSALKTTKVAQQLRCSLRQGGEEERGRNLTSCSSILSS